tara:strand:- start:147 stop:938 length:792 start_codon:yes stop_codon:yes gene_type:complete
MKLDIKFDVDPGIALEKLARKFGEDAAQATTRLAVSGGKNLANKSQPWGLGPAARETITENVMDAAQRVCYVIPPKKQEFMERLKRGGRGARVKYKAGFGGWKQVQPNQIMTDERQINRQIDKVRAGKTNPPRWIPWEKMVVCSNAAFQKAMTARRKRVGMNKGGWLGAGIAASRLQGGPERARIGKNVANWAQKHMRKGRASWDGSGRYINLVNTTRNADQLLPSSGVQAAMEQAWQDTQGWYKKAIRRREKKWGAFAGMVA